MNGRCTEIDYHFQFLTLDGNHIIWWKPRTRLSKSHVKYLQSSQMLNKTTSKRHNNRKMTIVISFGIKADFNQLKLKQSKHDKANTSYKIVTHLQWKAIKRIDKKLHIEVRWSEHDSISWKKMRHKTSAKADER